MGEELNNLIEVLNSIINRLENKPDRTHEENLLLIDARIKLNIARSFSP